MYGSTISVPDEKPLTLRMHLKDKTFELFIKEETIQAEIARLAANINHDFENLNPLFIGVLNGAFMFAADLLKNITIPSEVTFIKVKSYRGIQSTGQIDTLLGLENTISNRHIIILEDIVDTGHTVQHLRELLQSENPASITMATLLFKPEALLTPVDLKYVGIEIPNQFVVGYGLDYNGQGRNLRHIYRLKM